MGLVVDIKKKLSGFTLNVNFDTRQDVMGLLGSSGSGKSMTLRCIAGIEKPDKGRIVLNDRTLFDSDKGINIPSRMRKIGYLFQNYALFPNMTVEENIGFALNNLPKTERKNIIQKNIEMMKLNGLEKRYPIQLSGGQQQRVALARALAIEPEALLLDEPFSALDDHLRSFLTKQLIDTLTNYNGVTLFVTHNMEEAYKICNKLIVLKGGNVEAAGDKKEILENPMTKATAQLTGCKNFSKARYLSSRELFATEWGIKLNCRDNLNNNIKYVGIRAHYIKEALEECNENVFTCWPSFISEGPFRVTVYLSIGSKALNSEDYHLQWEASKEEWLELKDQPLPWKIYLDPVKLMIFYK
ncbi:MAG: sulfate/molybdate ABC transporter ATP-binding protein [Bacillota bacterium]|nr:sulfate/molybdate ABC transporter ATP-binding protein [Bacillota bacterium]